MPSLRVLHYPTNIGNNPLQLATAERALGLDSTCGILYPHVLYKETPNLAHVRYLTPHHRSFARQGLAIEWNRWRFLPEALTNYDLYHFNFGLTLLPSLNIFLRPGFGLARHLYNLYARPFHLQDLKLLHRLGKPMFFTFQGTDARQWSIFSQHLQPNTDYTQFRDHLFSPVTDSIKKRAIATIDRYATKIYALNPDLLHGLPERAEFLPYAALDIHAVTPHYPSNTPDQPIHVMHAPSNRFVKGTEAVLAAVDRLKAEGVTFKFTLIENIPNHEAFQYYQQADILIDQLLIGWYGGLAVEFMALGKPVICYLNTSDFQFLPPGMAQDMPIINATERTIYDVLKRHLTTNATDLHALGRRSRYYVETYHDPKQIAARLWQDYQDAWDNRQ